MQCSNSSRKMIKSENAKNPSAKDSSLRAGGSNSSRAKGKKIGRCVSFFFAGLSGLMLGGVLAFGAIFVAVLLMYNVVDALETAPSGGDHRAVGLSWLGVFLLILGVPIGAAVGLVIKVREVQSKFSSKSNG